MMDENGVNCEKSGRDEMIPDEFGGIDIVRKGSACSCEGNGCLDCKGLGYIPVDDDFDVD